MRVFQQLENQLIVWSRFTPQRYLEIIVFFTAKGRRHMGIYSPTEKSFGALSSSAVPNSAATSSLRTRLSNLFQKRIFIAEIYSVLWIDAPGMI